MTRRSGDTRKNSLLHAPGSFALLDRLLHRNSVSKERDLNEFAGMGAGNALEIVDALDGFARDRHEIVALEDVSPVGGRTNHHDLNQVARIRADLLVLFGAQR